MCLLDLASAVEALAPCRECAARFAHIVTRRPFATAPKPHESLRCCWLVWKYYVKHMRARNACSFCSPADHTATGHGGFHLTAAAAGCGASPMSGAADLASAVVLHSHTPALLLFLSGRRKHPSTLKCRLKCSEENTHQLRSSDAEA